MTRFRTMTAKLTMFTKGYNWMTAYVSIVVFVIVVLASWCVFQTVGVRTSAL